MLYFSVDFMLPNILLSHVRSRKVRFILNCQTLLYELHIFVLYCNI